MMMRVGGLVRDSQTLNDCRFSSREVNRIVGIVPEQALASQIVGTAVPSYERFLCERKFKEIIHRLVVGQWCGITGYQIQRMAMARHRTCFNSLKLWNVSNVETAT